MSMKVLAGFAAALVVTTVGVFAAGGGSSLFNTDSGPSPCSQKTTCPLSAAVKPACCSESEDAVTEECPAVCPSAAK